MGDLLNTTRRSFLAAAAATLSIELLVPRGLESQSSARNLSGVTGIHNEDPSFLAEVDKHFPGLSLTPEFNLVKRHATLFHNTTGRHIRGATIQWRLTGDDGRVQLLNAHYLVQSQKMLSAGPGHKKRGCLVSGRRTLIPSGERFLATPLFLCTRMARNKHAKAKNLNHILGGIVRKHESLAEKLTTHDAQAASTGVFCVAAFDGGQYSSIADSRTTNHFMRHFFNRRLAEQDEAQSLLEFIRQGRQQDEVITELQVRATNQVKPRTNGHTRIYAKTRRRFARQALRHIQRKGLTKTTALLEAVSRLPRYKPHRITL